MTAIRLARRPRERLWGRHRLPSGFADCADGSAPVGEIWFENHARDSLLVKYLFTSERLSIQVHPDDELARSKGYEHGKDEAWLILDADPGAVIGLGLKRRVTKEQLRQAALDGTIEALIDWRPVKAGDSFYSPAGTIHAIGAGLSLIEIQHNVDLTYRLYDYGRNRELHLEAALEAAHPAPFADGAPSVEQGAGRRLLTPGRAFAVERWSFWGRHVIGWPGAELLLIPLSDVGHLDGNPLTTGSVWRVEGEALLEAGAGVDLLAAYPGAARKAAIRAESASSTIPGRRASQALTANKARRASRRSRA